MIDAESFISPALQAGYGFYTGVPCSFLTPMINRVIDHRDLAYVAATSEGEAVAIAAGAWLAGRKTVVMMQNSGLGNAVNPLTSLNFPFRIPTLLIITWRGGPGVNDEPQHELMGKITPDLLDVIGVPHRPFPTAADEIGPTLAEAEASMDDRARPFALVMAKGSVRDEALQAEAPSPHARGAHEDLTENGPRPARAVLLERLLGVLPDAAAVIATTGKCGRELFTLADRRQHLYQVGSMGCAAAMGLGVALNVERPVVVIDGDGAALMKMGTLATIGAYGPANLIHLVLDNGVHDSTGGQPTVSETVNFAGVALSCGYARAFTCDGADGFERAVVSALNASGPHLVHARIRPGSMAGLGRPTVAPADVARRFRAFLLAKSGEGRRP